MESNQCHRVKAYAASFYCPASEEWEIKALFMARKDAICMCEEKIRAAVRANKPLEHWRVEKYFLCPPAGEVTWGCDCVRQADDLGAPDCV